MQNANFIFNTFYNVVVWHLQRQLVQKGEKGLWRMQNRTDFWRNIVSRTSLCLHKLIQTRINVWNNLFLIEYNNIIQTNGI